MPILIEHFDLLWQAVEKARIQHDLILSAWVVLPDHIHMLLEHDTQNISNVMRQIKLAFSANYRKRVGLREGRVWQHRFWDHIIRDQDDLNRHIDYIHYNPVKHGATDSPFLWKYSSSSEYLKEGYYASDWGVQGSMKIEGEFGE
ncbi:MAG: transposase [candidate division Zixibacteria bacterium]|nr:transposase [candidate division Zixibacteria bacterium]